MLKKYWKLFWKFRKLSLYRTLNYKMDALNWALIGALWAMFNIFFFSIIYQVDNGLAGWSVNELLLLISTYTIMDSVTWSFFYNSMREYTDNVYDGSLDLILTKPIDPQFYLMSKKNSYTNISRFLIGFVGIIIAINKMNLDISFGNGLVFVVIIFNNLMIIYSIWFILATLAIYFENLDNINNVIPSLRRFMQLPRQVYSGFLSVILQTIIPLGIITSIPAEILLGRTNITMVIYSFIVMIIFILLSRAFFFHALKKYSGVGA